MPIYRKLQRLVLISLAPFLCSCTSIAYYGQSISGQLQLLRAQRDFSEVYNDASVSEEIKERLRIISGIRDFASERLSLPDNDSYRKFADIGRRYIVWNVFASPALSLEPHQSCFFVVGCLSYRGYFHRKDALSYMEQLQHKGFDVYLGGVSAYSTLGWFDDPVLNGMLERSNVDLARLIFHELAHQRLYLPDDSEFNEAFAEAVARIGVEYWLENQSDEEQHKDFISSLAREREFNELVLLYRSKLEALYATDISDKQKLADKQRILSSLKSDYLRVKESWGGNDDYDQWIHEVNNARIAAVSTYQSLVPDFLRMYIHLEEDLDRFYTEMEALSSCSRQGRREILDMHKPGTDCMSKDSEKPGSVSSTQRQNQVN